MKILITGGTGYIGSHAAVALAEAGHSVVLYDNLCNSRADVVDRLEVILGRRPAFVEGDIRDVALLERTLAECKIDAVMHFAGLKAVGESVLQPLRYYENNVFGSLCLLQAMKNAGVKRLVFSSSATVYGVPQYLPYDELHPLSPSNTYGWNKLHIENMLSSLAVSDTGWCIASLRYFNPVGAHGSGLIGEDPNGIPNNLMPFISRVAAGKLPELPVFGGDYPTADGTGVRDYIHVMDLAEGHLAALSWLTSQKEVNDVFNLGTGCGRSVLEIIDAFQSVNAKQIPYRIVDRRPGDIAEFYANADKASRVLGWRTSRDLHSMCADAWAFQATQSRVQ